MRDGSVIAQLGLPDMRLPIQYALFYPESETDEAGREGGFWERSGLLDSEEPDMETFYGLRLGIEAGRLGGSMPTVFNM